MNIEHLLPTTDAAEAITFLKTWHRANGLVSLSLGVPGFALGKHTVTDKRTELTATIKASGLDDMVYLGDKTWDVYVSASTLKERPPIGMRGGKALVKATPGVWLDIDAGKPGTFTDEAEAVAFAEAMPIKPSILVSTGSGGVHAWWRHEKPLVPAEAEALGVRWRALGEKLSGRSLDSVSNSDRVMRLPGAIRWPKTIGQLPARVRLLSADGPDFDQAEMRRLTESAWNEIAERRIATRRQHQTLSLAGLREAEDLTGWSGLLARTAVFDQFEHTATWHDILAPHGWTEIGTDYEGRAIWSRPGGDGGKSATTDWPEAPNVMSLFSLSPETGLRDLVDAGIQLTKTTVHVALAWGGDYAGFVRAYLKENVK